MISIVEIQNMLSHLSANCSRDEWCTVAIGLKHNYHNNENAGWVIFNNWSKTAPELYSLADTIKLWQSIAVDKTGLLTTSSIVKKAIQNGYMPSQTE